MISLAKIKKAITHPRLVIAYLKRRLAHRYEWEEASGPLKRKHYQTYADYLAHQKSKLEKVQATWLPAYDLHYREELKGRLEKDQIILPGMKVLCLAARIGTEVKSFLDLSCFAVGIDLNPGRENKYVVYGDFHHLQFTDQSVDVVFTNSLDHALDLPQVVSEIRRVLRPAGFLILEVMKGEEEGNKGGYRYYESLSWRKLDELLAFFHQAGFRIRQRKNFSYPLSQEPAEHVVLSPEK